jgi:hypothetical protein
LNTLGNHWLNVTERDLLGANPYLTPWGGFADDNNGRRGWLDDWANATVSVQGGGFDWRLTDGWNLVSAPQNAVRRVGLNAYFDAQDAIEECVADGVNDPNLKIATKTNTIAPSTYTTYTRGDLETSPTNFQMQSTKGYWIYVSPGTLFAPLIVHFDALDWPSNGTIALNLANNWNLIGFPHNRSLVDWSNGLSATDFAMGVVDPDIDVQQIGGTQARVVITYWFHETQMYQSFVRQQDPWFPGVAARDWAWEPYGFSDNPGVGVWLWVASPCTLDYDVDASY